MGFSPNKSILFALFNELDEDTKAEFKEVYLSMPSEREMGIYMKFVKTAEDLASKTLILAPITHVMPEVLLQAAGVGDEIYTAISDGTYAIQRSVFRSV